MRSAALILATIVLVLCVAARVQAASGEPGSADCTVRNNLVTTAWNEINKGAIAQDRAAVCDPQNSSRLGQVAKAARPDCEEAYVSWRLLEEYWSSVCEGNRDGALLPMPPLVFDLAENSEPTADDAATVATGTATPAPAASPTAGSETTQTVAPDATASPTPQPAVSSRPRMSPNVNSRACRKVKSKIKRDTGRILRARRSLSISRYLTRDAIDQITANANAELAVPMPQGRSVCRYASAKLSQRVDDAVLRNKIERDHLKEEIGKFKTDAPHCYPELYEIAEGRSRKPAMPIPGGCSRARPVRVSTLSQRLP